ncbi:MFS transporter [Neofusicoccum parvum]|uniref:MFS transporter n=1 Tax=Neofusicoccum parvum TaxID=310453 RepID=A0ACB5SMD9_9PEZI|nr:MFS transporter [Neofusicoccum parvum]
MGKDAVVGPIEAREVDDSSSQEHASTDDRTPPPLTWKLASVVLISLIGFGSNWSAGITGAMKSTLKKELHINNKQFSLLEASEDFIVTALILWSGVVTDKIGGANAIIYGNIIYSIGSIVIASAAQIRSYKTMIGGRVISTFGDVATQVAQYKMFSSWFPPNNGFGSTLGLQLGLGKIGSFVGKATANVIAKNTGNFAWTFWVAVFINIFTNIMTIVFYWFNRVATKKFVSRTDPATGEQLTEKNKKFELQKVLELPWVYWAVLAFSLLETSVAIVFLQNATELAEQRFGTDSVSAGWYSALSQYAGFFLVPLIGIFIDLLGNRISLMVICGIGVSTAMALINWSNTTQGTAAAFGIYAFAYSIGPTTIIDSIRTSMWHQSVFGTAYGIKIGMNNAMNIIVRVITGAIQDRDNNSYDHVVIVYVVLSMSCVVVSLCLVLISWRAVDLRRLQWTRKQRIAKGDLIVERKDKFYGEDWARNRMVSRGFFAAFTLLVLGSWCAYFWGVATGNND